jgi:imidazolonepropionase-like amidohydrolase
MSSFNRRDFIKSGIMSASVATARLNATGVAGETSDVKITHAIVGGQVVDGSGAGPIRDGVVLIAGKRFAAVGPAGVVKIPESAKVIQAGGMTVMPGLIDMHVHLACIGSSDGDAFVGHHLDREEGEVMPASARQHILNGQTTVRDLGAPLSIVKVRDRINRGELVGARLFVAGPLLQKRHDVSLLGWSWNVSGPDDARQKVRQLVAAGVDWIKIHDQIDFSDEEVQAITEEAARAHKPVAAHAFESDTEILRALRYHVTTFEHTGLGASYRYSEETIAAIIQANACLDPTLAVRYTFFETERFPARIHDQIASKCLPPDIYKYLTSSLADYEHIPYWPDADRRWSKNVPHKIEPLIQGGAKIVVGTDSGEPLLIHGSTTWYELKNLVHFGMTPLEAITAATSRSGQLLAPDIGQIQPGFRADLIMVKGDVLQDINLLQNVQHVIKDGVQYK